MGRTLVVVPTYKERRNIERLCRAILAQGTRIDVLVVDDNSPDGTGELVRRLGQDEPGVHLLRRRGKLGLGTALIAGIRWALDREYERLITMDADFSHPPDCIPAMIEASHSNEVAIGSRYVPGGGYDNWPLKRVVLSGVSNWVARTFLRLAPRDCTGGFRCYRADVLQAIPLGNICSRGYSFQEEMLWQCSGRGWRFAEVPIIFTDRSEGVSKISLREIVAAVFTIVRLVFTPEGRKTKAGRLSG